MTFEPSNRRLYTDAVRPPAGHVFDRGIATTFTLDLTALLSVPLHLTLFAQDQNTEELLGDSVGLLEALRRTTERLQVYCHQGMIAVPPSQNVLFSLLEPVVIEARAPGRGFFHPKLWVLRFLPDGGGEPRLRLIALSRNLARDHAWDLMLTMDGLPRKRRRAANASLVQLLSRLPDMAAPGAKKPDRGLAESLAEEVARTEWEPPEPFHEVRFHALGLDREGWKLPEGEQLLVFSPYVAAGALETLSGTAPRRVALVSRFEELARLEDDVLALFEKVYHLDPIAMQEDSEGSSEPLSPQAGFHAKAYVLKRGQDTHVIMGSANATGAAFGGANVELLVELVGRWKWVGKPENLLEESGLVRILQEYFPPAEPPIPDAQRKAEAALEKARQKLIATAFRVHCEEREDAWWMMVQSRRRPTAEELPGVAEVRIWPITIHPEMGRDLFLTEAGEEIAFSSSVSSLTGFFAFRLKAKGFDLDLRFVLNLPATGIPEARYSAILRSVIANRERFIRYLLLLLGTAEEGWLAAGSGGRDGFDTPGSWEDVPLLEEMVRALCRDPDRLRTVGAIVRRLQEEEGSQDVIPEGFLALWETLREELGDAVK